MSFIRQKNSGNTIVAIRQILYKKGFFGFFVDGTLLYLPGT